MKAQPPYESVEENMIFAGCRAPCQPGDILAVKETFWQASSYPGCTPSGEPESDASCRGSLVHYATNGNPPDTPNHHYPTGLGGVHYFSAPDPYAMWKKRPSIHMPLWAVRSWLRVTGVTVRRVQEMTAADAVGWQVPPAEDCQRNDGCDGMPCAECHIPVKQAVAIWDANYAKRGLGWDKNPWCFVTTVEMADRPGGI